MSLIYSQAPSGYTTLGLERGGHVTLFPSAQDQRLHQSRKTVFQRCQRQSHGCDRDEPALGTLYSTYSARTAESASPGSSCKTTCIACSCQSGSYCHLVNLARLVNARHSIRTADIVESRLLPDYLHLVQGFDYTGMPRHDAGPRSR